MSGALHSTPRWGDVVLEQIRTVGLRLRREALVGAIVLGIVTIFIGKDIVTNHATTWFDSDEWFPIAIGAFLLPFAIWRGERPFGPAFLWTLPVDRRLLALARVFGGWVSLMCGVAIFFTWQLALAALSHVEGARTLSVLAFSGATGAYLLGSALVLGLRHPLRWLIGTVAMLFLLGSFNDRVDALLRVSDLSTGIHDAVMRWQTMPPLAQWSIATLLWLVIGLAALFAAISRHRENRRH